MPERLYQLQFDEQFKRTLPEDVTPKNFTGFRYTITEQESLPRFVREVTESIRVTSPEDAVRYLFEHVYTPFEEFDQEEIWVLLLNTQNHITHDVMVYRGTVNAAYVREAELVREAVRLNMPALILSHCHPSGDPTPSPEDIQLTSSVVQAAKVLNLNLLDHLIVGKERWVSLRDEGLGFE